MVGRGRESAREGETESETERQRARQRDRERDREKQSAEMYRFNLNSIQWFMEDKCYEVYLNLGMRSTVAWFGAQNKMAQMRDRERRTKPRRTRLSKQELLCRAMHIGSTRSKTIRWSASFFAFIFSRQVRLLATRTSLRVQRCKHVAPLLRKHHCGRTANASFTGRAHLLSTFSQASIPGKLGWPPY